MSLYNDLVDQWSHTLHQYHIEAQEHEEFALALVKTLRTTWEVPPEAFSFFPLDQELHDTRPASTAGSATRFRHGELTIRFRVGLTGEPGQQDTGIVFLFTIQRSAEGWLVRTEGSAPAYIVPDQTPSSLAQFASEFYAAVDTFLAEGQGSAMSAHGPRLIGFREDE